MGLLDDAIREHLELKRRAGADAVDVARAEREALGQGDPVAEDLGGPYADPHTAADPAYAPAEPAYDRPEAEYAPPPGDPPAGPAFYDAGADDDADAPRYAPPPPSPPPPPPPPPPPARYSPPPPAQAPPPPPPPRPPPPPPPPARYGPPPPGPATEEFGRPPHEPEPDDVLERTPDFLEETPEHDRLWFEQAPPQEFDFDK